MAGAGFELRRSPYTHAELASSIAAQTTAVPKLQNALTKGLVLRVVHKYQEHAITHGDGGFEAMNP